MPEQILRDRRILIVEDEYLLAEDLRLTLTRAGAVVVGMASTVKDALDLIEREDKLDAAVLDINLGDTPVFPVADRLAERGVPFVLTTGYDISAIPPRFQAFVQFEKPFRPATVVRSLQQVIADCR